MSKNKLNFEISVKETKKDYVERIDIFGNTNTYEEVIRNELLIDEGDGYNKILHNKSIANLKALGFFGKVTSEMLEGSTDNITFTTIHTVNNQEIWPSFSTFYTNGEEFSADQNKHWSNYYNVSNPGYYKYYRFKFG